VRFLPLFLLLLLARGAAAADSLDCDLARGATSLPLSSPLADGQAETQTPGNELGLGLDSSLASQSYLFVLDDLQRHRRVAYSGAPGSAWFGGSSLEVGEARVRCRQHLGQPPVTFPARPVLPDYFVCLVDEARYAGNELEGSDRRITKVTTQLNPRAELKVDGEDAHAAFRVRYLSYDPAAGLEITLTDKATGETARYVGPGRSLVTSFLFGLTIGDRAASARFLRLGCVWTADPKLFR
jgi:hypothetical protein